MTRQLELLEENESVRPDPKNRAVGRRGVEQARAALLEARRRLAEHDRGREPRRRSSQAA